ncbi:MAG: HAD family hydrolase [Clostridia bacterium]|nr:HAD family hydrolase [Clostridia bacterium]
MVYDVILFDLDGTLTDSAEGIVNSVVYALERKGVPYASKQALRRFVGPPLQDAFRDYCGFSEEEAKDAVRLFREYFTEKGIYENAVYEGVPEMLRSLCKAGFRLAVATSKPEAFAKQILERFDLAKYFTVIAGASMDGTDKPTVIRQALSRLHTEPSFRALMVGDREHDIFGAKEVGIASLGVLYGYGSEEELKEAGAAYLADSPSAIVSHCLQSPGVS